METNIGPLHPSKQRVQTSSRGPAPAVLALVSLLLCFADQANGQRRTVSGTVVDGQTGEVLIGANVRALTPSVGTATNTYGFYSLTVSRADSVTVVYTHVGYWPRVKKVFLADDLVVDVELHSEVVALDEIVVTGESADVANVRETRMGVVDVPVRAVERLPAILGEQDVLKLLQLLPGVQAGNEGTTGYHVRGGAVDQNLVLLDEATVYNPSHLFGLFSTFNARALNNVELIKGGFPAYYGGRLSSTLRVTMREGNRRDHDQQGGIGLISSHLTVEGPISRDRASYMVSARRSYLDLIIRPFQKSDHKNLYYFYDVNAKVNYRIATTDRVYVSLFTGRDVAEYVGSSSVGYGVRFGNSTGTLRWNHIFGSRLFSNTSLILNRYFIRINNIQGQYYSQNYSGIDDLSAKTELEYYRGPEHNIRVGGLLTRHVFRSTGSESRVPTGQNLATIDTSRIPQRASTEAALWFNNRWELSKHVGLNFGLRTPLFRTRDTTYVSAEPRVSVRFGIGPTSSLKTSYTLMNQFVHLIPSSTASVPTDIWASSSRIIRPQRSQQVALGYFRNVGGSEYEASLELYYKEMENQVHFRPGTQLLAYEAIEHALTFGRGWSYGAELFVERAEGRLSGWLSYTLSWTRQRFSDLNDGRSFPFKYDRRHNLAIAATLLVNDRWTLSANAVYRSGSAYTLPVGRLYASQGGDLYSGLFFDYDRVNNYRLGDYHRIDLSAVYSLRPKYFSESELVFSVYNAYSRLNPYFVYMSLDNATGEPIARQVTLLPIVPSVSFNFTF